MEMMEKEWEDWKGVVKIAILGVLHDVLDTVLEIEAMLLEEKGEWNNCYEELELSPYMVPQTRRDWSIAVNCRQFSFLSRDPLPLETAKEIFKKSFWAADIATTDDEYILHPSYANLANIEGLSELLAWGTGYIPERVMGLLKALDEFASRISQMGKA